MFFIVGRGHVTGGAGASDRVQTYSPVPPAAYAESGNMSPSYKGIPLCKRSCKNAYGVAGEVNLRRVCPRRDIDKQRAALAFDADVFAADQAP